VIQAQPLRSMRCKQTGGWGAIDCVFPCGRLQDITYQSKGRERHNDIGPLINLGMQHDRRSAQTWMKRVLTTFVSLWEGEKDLLESTKMDFYET
jgi:hypothetical protein